MRSKWAKPVIVASPNSCVTQSRDCAQEYRRKSSNTVTVISILIAKAGTTQTIKHIKVYF